MRILYFSRGYTPHDHRFLSTISAAGHELLYLRLEGCSSQLEERPLPSSVRQLHWPGGESASYSWLSAPFMALSLRRIIREFKPDLVHAGPIQTSAFITALAGFHPLLTMSWGYDLMQDADRSRWWAWATQFTLRRSDFFISDANVTREKAVTFGMHPGRTVTFPWGVDLEQFSPARHGGTAPEKFMLFCNRSWEPLYAVDVVARAFVKVAQARPEAGLILLGSGSQAASLRQILLDGDVLDRVYFGGKIPQAQLPGWYHQADLYLSASHVDGSSVSLMEAMACGLPVMVSDIPGNREWVNDGINGWLFGDGDVDDLARKILHAIEKRQSLPEMGRRSRTIAEERADWKKNAATLLQTYETIASLGRKRPERGGKVKNQLR